MVVVVVVIVVVILIVIVIVIVVVVMIVVFVVLEGQVEIVAVDRGPGLVEDLDRSVRASEVRCADRGRSGSQ